MITSLNHRIDKVETKAPQF